MEAPYSVVRGYSVIGGGPARPPHRCYPPLHLFAALALLHGEVAWREDLEVQLTHERLDEHSLLDAVLLLAVALDAQDAHELGVE